MIQFNDIYYEFDFNENIAEVKGLFYAKSSDYEKIKAYNQRLGK